MEEVSFVLFMRIRLYWMYETWHYLVFLCRCNLKKARGAIVLNSLPSWSRMSTDPSDANSNKFLAVFSVRRGILPRRKSCMCDVITDTNGPWSSSHLEVLNLQRKTWLLTVASRWMSFNFVDREIVFRLVPLPTVTPIADVWALISLLLQWNAKSLAGHVQSLQQLRFRCAVTFDLPFSNYSIDSRYYDGMAASSSFEPWVVGARMRLMSSR